MTDYSADDGRCPELLEHALQSGSALAVAAAVRNVRLLIPVVPAPAGALPDEEHCGVGDGMASVTFIANDGRRALLGFSSLAALEAWDPRARPLPQAGQQIARTVLDAELDALIVDIASDHRTALQGHELRLAAGSA